MDKPYFAYLLCYMTGNSPAETGLRATLSTTDGSIKKEKNYTLLKNPQGDIEWLFLTESREAKRKSSGIRGWHEQDPLEPSVGPVAPS